MPYNLSTDVACHSCDRAFVSNLSALVNIEICLACGNQMQLKCTKKAAHAARCDNLSLHLVKCCSLPNSTLSPEDIAGSLSSASLQLANLAVSFKSSHHSSGNDVIDFSSSRSSPPLDAGSATAAKLDLGTTETSSFIALPVFMYSSVLQTKLMPTVNLINTKENLALQNNTPSSCIAFNAKFLICHTARGQQFLLMRSLILYALLLRVFLGLAQSIADLRSHFVKIKQAQDT